jgi:SET domain-containing protein
MKELPDNKINVRESSYLYISLSQLPSSGNGLYTAINIYKNETIAVFKGEILTDSQAIFRARKGEDKYFMNMPDGSILDARKRKCFAKYANDTKGSSNSDFKNNAKIALDESDNICLAATRNIRPGEEIFCSYGKSYWKKHGVKPADPQTYDGSS